MTNSSVHVKRGYDLRTPLDDKIYDCHSLADITVFLNRAHNLAHVFFRGEVDAYLRLRVPADRLKGTNDKWVSEWFTTRLQRFI